MFRSINLSALPTATLPAWIACLIGRLLHVDMLIQNIWGAEVCPDEGNDVAQTRAIAARTTDQAYDEVQEARPMHMDESTKMRDMQRHFCSILTIIHSDVPDHDAATVVMENIVMTALEMQNEWDTSV